CHLDGSDRTSTAVRQGSPSVLRPLRWPENKAPDDVVELAE
ncbi:MAG: hypothetical protein ACI8RC_002935, partial [Ilumatobacter sp.]